MIILKKNYTNIDSYLSAIRGCNMPYFSILLNAGIGSKELGRVFFNDEEEKIAFSVNRGRLYYKSVDIA